MLKDGVLNETPERAPSGIEVLTLRDSMPGQTFVIPAAQCRIDSDKYGWVFRDADLALTKPEAGVSHVRVIHMNEGFVVDMHTKEEFTQPEGIKRLPYTDTRPFFDEDKWFRINTFITNQDKYDEIAAIYEASFQQKLEYAPFTASTEAPKTSDRFSKAGIFIAGYLAAALVHKAASQFLGKPR